MTTETLERPVATSAVDIDLDVRILTSDPVMAALLNSTANECNTDDQDAHDESL
jgi:hypothetical protein